MSRLMQGSDRRGFCPVEVRLQRPRNPFRWLFSDILIQALLAFGSADHFVVEPSWGRRAAPPERAGTGLITNGGCARWLRPSRQREPPLPRARSRYQFLAYGLWKSEGFRQHGLLRA